MRNYYNQYNELKMAKARLNSLEEKRKMYFQMALPHSPKIGNKVNTGGAVNDLFAAYLSKIEAIDAEIKIVKEEIKLLQKGLNEMAQCLSRMDGTLVKIFVLRYIDGMSVKQISHEVAYSPTQIYRNLRVIKEVLKDGKK